MNIKENLFKLLDVQHLLLGHLKELAVLMRIRKISHVMFQKKNVLSFGEIKIHEIIEHPESF